MTGTSGIRAVCGGCGAAYRVPAAGRAYACKHCGGAVRAEDAEPTAPHLVHAAARACHACHAVLPTESRFCPECGAAWEPHATGADGTPAPKPSLAERRHAALDLGRARRAIGIVRGIFWFYVVVFSLGIFGGLALLRAPEAMEPDEALLLVGMCTLLAVLALAGANLAARHPFACSVSIASFWSLGVALQALAGELGIVPVAIAVVLWVLVIPTVRVARLLRAHPDLYVARRILGAHPADGTHGAQVLRDSGRRAWLRLGVQATALVLLVALATAGAWSRRPRSPGAWIAGLADAWNRADADALVALFADERQAAEREHLAGALARRGWDTAWPRLERPDVAALVPVAAADQVTGHRYRFTAADTELHTRWLRAQGGWVLDEIWLPPPPLEPGLAEFAAAWPRPDALAALYPERSRDRMRASFERLVERRGWSASPPALGVPEVRVVDEDSREVHYAVGAGRLRTRWTLSKDDDRWHLTVLEPPQE
jgi:hypothetical protein